MPDGEKLLEIFERESSLGPLRVEFEELIRICSWQKANIVLDIFSDGHEGHIYFQKGNLVHAITGPHQGADAFSRIQSWRAARFKVRPLKTAVACSITEGIEKLLERNTDDAR